MLYGAAVTIPTYYCGSSCFLFFDVSFLLIAVILSLGRAPSRNVVCVANSTMPFIVSIIVEPQCQLGGFLSEDDNDSPTLALRVIDFFILGDW